MALPAISTLESPEIIVWRDDPRAIGIMSISPFPVAYIDVVRPEDYGRAYVLWGDPRRADIRKLWPDAAYQRLIRGDRMPSEHQQALDFFDCESAGQSVCIRRCRTVQLPRGTGRLVGLGSGNAALNTNRRWPLNNCLQLARELDSRGCGLAFFGSKEEGEDYGVALTKAVPKLVNLAGKLSLSETAGAIEQCDLMITPDSGLMHLADAVGTFSVSLWGPSNWRKSRPANGLTEPVFSPKSCAPCWGRAEYQKCVGGCMAEITTDAVLDAALQMLDLGGKKPRVLFATHIAHDRLAGDVVQNLVRIKALSKIARLDVLCAKGSEETASGIRKSVEGCCRWLIEERNLIAEKVRRDWRKYDYLLCQGEPVWKTLLSSGIPAERLLLLITGKDAYSPRVNEIGSRARVITTAEGFRDLLKQRAGIAANIVSIGIDEERIRGGRRTVCYVGNLYEYQRVHLIIDALERLRRPGRDVRFLCIADRVFKDLSPGYKSTLTRRLKSNDWIEWTCAQPNEIGNLLRRADVCVAFYDPEALATRQQCKWGISTKILEYMAAGKPVVANRIWGNELLLGAEYPYFAETPEEMAERIGSVLDHPADALRVGAELLERAEAFGLDSTAESFETVFGNK